MTITDEFAGLAGIEDSIDGSLYDTPGKQYPAVVWIGKVDDSVKKSGGYWVLNRDAIPDQTPEPFWATSPYQFGSDPNAPQTDVWLTPVLRCVPIGIRKRAIITDKQGIQHFYPIMTKRDNRIEGTFRAHFQLMIVIPGVIEPLVIGLKGISKTKSWDNPASGRWADASFPVGAWQVLNEYTSRAKNQTKIATLQEFCTWWVDLRAAYRDGKPLFAEVGSSDKVWVSPFVADMRTSKDGGEDGLPRTRFVGKDMFEQLQTLRRDVVVSWEKEWDTVVEGISENGHDIDDDEDTNAPIENDEIPF